MDFDSDKAETHGYAKGYPWFSEPYAFTLFCNSQDSTALSFNQGYARTKKDFDKINRNEIATLLSVAENVHKPDETTYERDEVFVFKTKEGRLVKMTVRDWKTDWNKWGEWRHWEVKIQYVCYEK